MKQSTLNFFSNKNFNNLASLILLTIPAFTHAADLKISVNDVLSNDGQMVIRVFDNKKNWMSDEKGEISFEQSYSLSTQSLTKPFTTVIDLPEGEYGLFLFQDKDQNGELKSNWIGMPKEPVGTSNNAKGSMGPPKYKDAKFTVTTEGHSLSINLKNLN